MAKKKPTRQRIIESAFELFTNRGIELTSTREIAAVAECNEVTLFRHFNNKDGLVRAVIEWYIPTQDLPRVDQIGGSGRLEQDLIDLTTLVLEFHREKETFFKFVFANLVQHPDHGTFISSIQAPFLERLEQLFSPYLEGTDLSVESVIHEFMTPVTMRTVGRVFLRQEQLPADVFIRDHARLLTRSILASQPEDSPYREQLECFPASGKAKK